MLRIVIFILLFTSVLSAQQIPVGYSHWVDQADTTIHQQRIGGQISNYPTGESWSEIENNWITLNDTLRTNRRGVLKTDVNDVGQSTVTMTMEDQTFAVSQRLLKMVWINTATQNWIDIADVSWNTPTVDSNIIHWSNIIPAVDYRVRKTNGKVEHGVFFKPAFLDSAIVLYDQRSDTTDIALGNVMAYELTGVDNADSALGTIDARMLKRFARRSFVMSRQTVHFPGSDTLPPIPVKQRWIKQNGKIYCVEYVMMSTIKKIHEVLPTATIWHNDELAITGTTDIEDTYMHSGVADYNFGSSGIIAVTGHDGLVRVQNLGSLLGGGATISALVCSLYNNNNVTSTTISAYRVFKPWGEGAGDFATAATGEASGNDWSATTEEWATPYCACANDGGDDNSEDGGACTAARADRKSTAEDSFTAASFGWYTFDVTSALAQDWYDGDAVENGVFLEVTSGDAAGADFNSTEAGSNQIRFRVTYTTGAVEAPNRRRKMIIQSGAM